MKSDKPYEHLVVIDKKTNNVFGEYKGNEKYVYMCDDAPRYSSAIHGHPDMAGKSVTTPVSFTDYQFLSKKSDDK